MISLIGLFLVTGCGKSGTRFDNLAPTIKITSYEGFDDSATYTSQDTLSFQQKIYWHATDPDGVIAGFAYRILDASGNPIGTPGNQYIDTDGTITPTTVINKFGAGWVMHYLEGADQSLPLTDPLARRSIWTSSKYATINFPSADANGNPLPKLSKFEVIAIDNRGDVTATAAWRKFNTESARPVCNVNTTKGNPGGSAVGSGMKLSFTMDDFDPFIPVTPWYYEFKLEKHAYPDSSLTSSSDWYSTLHEEKLNEYMLTRYTTPALTYDFTNNTQTSYTQVVGRVYDLAGVVSTMTNNSKINFAVKPGFRPAAMIYHQKAYALGDNHYVDYTDDSTPEIMPFTISNGVQRFATPMFRDTQNRLTAVNSVNMKVWIRWGWDGEYGIVQSNGDILFPGTPYDKKVDVVRDATTGDNYFSEITHFDLRLNDAPYNFPPYANSIQVDNDGKRWLRIPVNSVLGQTVVLTSLPAGLHKFEVRCVDLQNEYSAPAEFFFNLVNPVAPASRSGVLIIDDDRDNSSYSPETVVAAKYQYMLSDYTGTKTFIHRTSDSATHNGDTYSDIRNRNLAYPDLQNYKLVIYHSDNPSDNGNLKLENDGLTLYMEKGGNFVISHSSKIAGILDAFVIAAQKTFLSDIGIAYVSSPAVSVSGAMQTNAFFQTALGQLGYPNVNVQFGTGDAASFNTLVNSRQGLATVAYFPNRLTTAETIYTYGCKPVNYPAFPPTQAQYDLYNGKPVGLRNVNGTGKTYLLGFPLSYMLQDDAKAMINKVLQDCGM
ncbi:MAG TPA: hypothetical protein PKI15_03490 [Candidatus Cloacimonadota bacterium]|nr:hypothetical protein [Candidatus Cloacimonadota bacterium]